MLLLKNSSLSLADTTIQIKLHCRFKHCAELMTHLFGSALAYRRPWHRFCTAWHQFYNFPDSFFPKAELYTCTADLTQTCVLVHLHTLESLSPPSAVKYWEPRSAAFSSERQLWERARVRERVCVRERERERESLCDIRPWDRESCREFDRINGH